MSQRSSSRSGGNAALDLCPPLTTTGKPASRRKAVASHRIPKERGFRREFFSNGSCILGIFAAKIDFVDSAPSPSFPWPHAPPHHLNVQGTFMVTASTYGKKKFFTDGPRLRMLHDALLKVSHSHDWQLEAWAVFPNHYHFVAHSSQPAESLRRLITELHSRTARALNRRDASHGRKVWHNYWETHVTFENSYFARLNYVHANPVKHGLVPVANLYPYGSAAWFERTATPAQVRKIYSFKNDELKIEDDF